MIGRSYSVVALIMGMICETKKVRAVQSNNMEKQTKKEKELWIKICEFLKELCFVKICEN